MIFLLAAMTILWIATVLFGIWAINGIYKSTMNHLYEQQKLIHAERLSSTQERDALLERIQRPEVRPVIPTEEVDDTPNFAVSDELYLVGTIQDGQTPLPDEAA